MSGGSFDYLFVWAGDAQELAKRTSDIGYMAELLERLDDGKLAARDTRAVLDMLQCIQLIGQKLEDVWHDVEWWQSGDITESRVHEALAQYNIKYGKEGDRELSKAVEKEGE
jgi:hypothetical protein